MCKSKIRQRRRDGLPDADKRCGSPAVPVLPDCGETLRKKKNRGVIPVLVQSELVA